MASVTRVNWSLKLINEFYDRSTVQASLMTNRDGHEGIISLPAKMFEHLPGGCVGVQ